MRRPTLLRLALLLAVAVFHALLLLCFVVYIEPAIHKADPPLTVMKLLDIQEELPPVPPPPPPPKHPEPPPPAPSPAAAAPAEAVEAIAEHMTVVEEAPDEAIVAPGTLASGSAAADASGGGGAGEEDYRSMTRVSKLPVFSERAIRDALEYPSIARRAGIEGAVILELFINKSGEIQRIDILRETPPGRGFGEAAAKAFQGLRCTPAEANGVPVGVRYRYPVRFQLR